MTHTASNNWGTVTLISASLTMAAVVLTSVAIVGQAFAAEPLQAVQIYSQDELLGWIKNNTHLIRVKTDDCQLVLDIEDRAVKVQIPAYQFLYGDMLTWGVCVDQDVERGFYFYDLAAKQGLPEAYEQLGRYYHLGKFVQTDIDRALNYLQMAAELGNVNAQVRYVQLLAQGYGSPREFPMAYQLLHNAIIADKAQRDAAEKALANLAQKMPPSVLSKAKKPLKG